MTLTVIKTGKKYRLMTILSIFGLLSFRIKRQGAQETAVKRQR